MSQKVLFASVAAALVALFITGAYWYRQAETQKLTQLAKEDSSSLIRDYSPKIGSPMLRVTLVEFLDPECESCRYFHPFVKQILEKHEGRIHYVVRYAPFHPNSKFIIRVLESARLQGKYWEALDLLFEKLPEWGDHHAPRPELVWTYLPSLDLDIDKLKEDMKRQEFTDMIEQEIKDGIKFNVRQTPTFFINGVPLKNFGPQELLEAVEAAMQ
jgi:protein-disulfide isomerase